MNHLLSGFADELMKVSTPYTLSGASVTAAPAAPAAPKPVTVPVQRMQSPGGGTKSWWRPTPAASFSPSTPTNQPKHQAAKKVRPAAHAMTSGAPWESVGQRLSRQISEWKPKK